MSKSAAQIVADPEWLAHRYDEGRDTFHYRRVARARHAEVPFATDDCLGAEPSPVVIRRDEAAGLITDRAPLHFIFHSAYCASTMLVRALDRPGSAMGLSEPVVLNDMVGWLGRGADPRFHGKVLDDALAQLARPWSPGEAVVVKPSNIFNGLAMGGLLLRPQAKAVLLHAPIEEFLLSVARKGMWCRLWVRELLEILLQHGLVDLGFEPRDYFRQSDLQVAGVGWLAQHKLFHRIVGKFGGRIATLDSETLTRDPATTVAKIAAHFGLKDVESAAYANHPALTRDSKSGDAYAVGQRQTDLVQARAAYGEEIDMVAQWVRVTAERNGVAMELGNSLI